MPYFSFSIKKYNFIKDDILLNCIINIDLNKTYFCKKTTLWKSLNKKKYFNYLNFIKYEKRHKVTEIRDKILFCLPPGIGLGDAIEYGLAIKSICINKKFKNVGIAFTGKFKYIFDKYFQIKNTYSDYISDEDLKKFNTIYHITLEIDSFKYQKYVRVDIEGMLTAQFNVPKIRNPKKNNKLKIESITIFPISQSPIRSMSPNILNKIIQRFGDDFKIFIVFDDRSEISATIEKNIIFKNYTKLNPTSLPELCFEIEKIDFGIFMDSGPLHLAKINDKKGILIETSVNNEILLNQFDNIGKFKNKYSSLYCSNTCGLTNIFNYNNKFGCYDSLGITQKELLNNKLNLLQRGSMKKQYSNFVINPVNCIKNIDISNLLIKISKEILK